MRCWKFLLLAVLISGLVSPAVGRTWTSRTGRFQVEAEYVETVRNSVRLRKTNGQVISFPLQLLSDSDRQYIRDLERQQPQDEQKNPPNKPLAAPVELIAESFSIRGGQSQDFQVRLAQPSKVTAEVRWCGLVREMKVSLVGHDGRELGTRSLKRTSAQAGGGTLRVDVQQHQLASVSVRVENTSGGTAMGTIKVSAAPIQSGSLVNPDTSTEGGVLASATHDCGHFDRLPASLERELRPAVQLKILEQTLQSEDLGDARRLQLTEEFAELALFLSPEYGQGTLEIDEGLWLSLLEKGHTLCGDEPRGPIVRALTKIYINRHHYADALRVVAPFHKKKPKHNLAAAWYEWSKMQLPSVPTLRSVGQATRPVPQPARPGRRPLVRPHYVNLPSNFEPIALDVHFCVITENEEAHRQATRDQLRTEVEILNRLAGTVDGKRVIGLRTIDNKQILQFQFKSAALYRAVEYLRDECGVVSAGDSNPKDSKIFAAFDDCRHDHVRDRLAVNFYIFDNTKGGESWGDERPSAGIWPIVLIDYVRLNNHVGNPEPHEMGHALGLQHVGIADATGRTATNIMSSGGLGFSSHQGTRTIGLTEAQTAIVVFHAKTVALRSSAVDVSGRVKSRIPPQTALVNCPVKLVAGDGSEHNTTTDSRGFYEFRRVPAGTCRIVAGAGSTTYVSEYKTADLIGGANRKFDFQLEYEGGKPK